MKDECVGFCGSDSGKFSWIGEYEPEDPAQYLMIDPIANVFPHCRIWNPVSSDILLVGSTQQYPLQVERMKARYGHARVAADLSAGGIESLLTVMVVQMNDSAHTEKIFPGYSQRAEWGILRTRIQSLLSHD